MKSLFLDDYYTMVQEHIREAKRLSKQYIYLKIKKSIEQTDKDTQLSESKNLDTKSEGQATTVFSRQSAIDKMDCKEILKEQVKRNESRLKREIELSSLLDRQRTNERINGDTLSDMMNERSKSVDRQI